MAQRKKVQKLPVKRLGLRVRAWPVMEEAVENGLRYGWNRSWKHVDMPKGLEVHFERIIEEQSRAIMGAISERFDFDEVDDDVSE